MYGVKRGWVSCFAVIVVPTCRYLVVHPCVHTHVYLRVPYLLHCDGYYDYDYDYDYNYDYCYYYDDDYYYYHHHHHLLLLRGSSALALFVVFVVMAAVAPVAWCEFSG